MTIDPRDSSDESAPDEQPSSSAERQSIYGLSKVVLATWPSTIRFLVVVGALALLVILGLWLLPIELRAGPIEITRQ
jgi:hypothetical protein